MEHLSDEFVRLRKKHGLGGRGQRYPEMLRRLAVEYGRWTLGVGRSVEEAAKALGVSPPTLTRWLDQAPTSPVSPAMREVTVVDETIPQPAGELVVWTPDGFRIEGVERAELAAVLSVLRG